MNRIDLNCDMGESFGPWKMGNDESLMPLITSANIACGWHAGDPGIIRTTVCLAAAHGVAIGAHPGFPDLQGFGRRAMKISPQEMYDVIVYQCGAVEAFARAAGTKLHHVKCHGMLYNMAAMDETLSDAIARAVKDLGGGVLLYALSNSVMMAAGERHGLTTIGEVFADRGYLDDGMLAPRSHPGGMITDAEEAVAQALSMAEHGVAVSLSGNRVPVSPGTICIHGDQPNAVLFAKALRKAFGDKGIAFKAP